MDICKGGLAALCLLLAAPADAATTSGFAPTISGLVYADGSVDVSSVAYTILHPKLGHYKIVFSNPMSPKASCTIVPIAGKFGGNYVQKIAMRNTNCEVVFGSVTGTGTVDTAFSFIAMPMTN